MPNPIFPFPPPLVGSPAAPGRWLSTRKRRTSTVASTIASIAVLILIPVGSLAGQDLPGRPGSLQLVGGVLDRSVDSDLRTGSSSWAALRSAISDEDQPLTTWSMSLEGGLWLLPWLSTEVRAGWADLDARASSEQVTFARAVVGMRWERFDLEGALWGGGFRRSEIERGDWSGGGVIRYEGPADVVLEVRSDRDAYLGTRASLDDSLTATLIQVGVSRRSETGWTGRISFTEALLSNENRIDDARVWFLAPVIRREFAGFRAGYGFRATDSDENSFTAALPWSLDYQGRVDGWYAGAYTPEETLSHALLLQLWYSGTDVLRAQLDGSLGFHAREDRPVLIPAVPGEPESGVGLQFQEKGYVPWDITGEAVVSLRPGWDLRFGGGYRRSAFQGGAFGELGASLSTPR